MGRLDARGQPGPVERAPTASRPQPCTRPRLRNPLHPQVAVGVAAGVDDPYPRPELQSAQPGRVSGGVSDPHVDVAQPTTAGVVGPGAPAGRHRRLPDGPARLRHGAGLPPPRPQRPADQQVVSHPRRVRHRARRVSALNRQLLPAGQAGCVGGVERSLAVRPIRARRDAGHPVHRQDGHERLRLPREDPDGPVRHPDQQDLDQQCAVDLHDRCDLVERALPARRAAPGGHRLRANPRRGRPG